MKFRDLKKLDREKSNLEVTNINVKVTKEFKIRVFIALRLIKLACYILNCGVEFKGFD